jgi:DNA mismatch endonuclease (patch repair protein)
MSDIVDPATRSRMMASIRGRDTTPELVVRKSLHAAGLRFRLHGVGLPGRPDIVLPSRRVVIFVHGCFWHRHHGCRFATTPATRPEFWARKFEANQRRDTAAESSLRLDGWQVVTIWECETRDQTRLVGLAAAIKSIPPTSRRHHPLRRSRSSP